MKFLSFFICLLLSLSSVLAQPFCGFNTAHNQQLSQNPDYGKNIQNFERIYKERGGNLNMRLAASGPDTIPVVVHVIHTGDAVGTVYNPSDLQIIEAIKYLNDVYSGTFPGRQGVGDMGLRFVLAQRDTLCNPTTGIVRVDGTVVNGYLSSGVKVEKSGVTELSIKNLSRWDPSRYYNIWVVNRLDGEDGSNGGTLGYAYFPGGSPNLDGTVLLARYMKKNDKTLPHEIGHAFALYHPFHPYNTRCADNEGDFCDDTDPVTSSFTARSGTNPCTNTSYNINTERNFMSYTQLFTLFTVNQKDRVLGAIATSRATLAQSTGKTPPSILPLCPPKVNFQTSLNTVAEATDSTSGCLGYKDYTLSVNLTSPLTADAEVQIIENGGTARIGIDYDIFTNGNLTSASNLLKFPTNALASQNFVLRVYDDIDIETEETIALKLNSLSGELKIGEAAPVISLKLTDNDALPIFPNTAYFQIPVGQSTTTLSAQSSASPFTGALSKNRVQVLYSSSELRQAGLSAGPIDGLLLTVSTKRSSRPYDNLNVSIGNTTTNAFVNSFITTGLTSVFLGSYTTQKGDNIIKFNKSFIWDGVSNLVIQFCYDNQGFTTSSDVVAGQSRDGGVATISLTSGGAGDFQACNSSASFQGTTRPYIQFLKNNPGNPVANGIISTESYLGPNANACFYDTTGKVLGCIKNLSDFDYGCTKLEIDRSGSGVANFWFNEAARRLTQKTFKVTPANPNPNGSYEITLYYTNAEKAGYESATGSSWTTASVVKSEGAISTITPSNQQASSVTVNNQVVFGTYNTDHTVKATFNNGFSGYAIGNPGTLTSVTDLQLIKKVKVYPNPVGKELYIRFENLQRNVNLRLLSAEGRILQNKRLNGLSQLHTLTIDQLNQGLYLLEIITEEGKATFPIIRQ
ncbi:MAG: zinc-dependent metalloprotease [Bacteroidetes bacterium]|nr:zinc-dependent metalloprotease [Bacteroidota bacterium]